MAKKGMYWTKSKERREEERKKRERLNIGTSK